MMWEYVFLEVIDNINSGLISHPSLGKAMVTHGLKPSEAAVSAAKVLLPLLGCGVLSSVHLRLDWWKKQLSF